MPATPKKIKFEDIQKGDKIRIVDVRDVSVEENRGFEIITGTGFSILAEPPRHDVKRTFQLLDREHSPLPTERGKVIEVDTERFVLVYDTYAPTDLWVSSRTGGKWTPVQLQRHADSVNGFEVIA